MDHTKQLEEAFRYVDQHFDNMLGEVQTACSFIRNWCNKG